MGELHLDIVIDRLSREFGVQANTGRPQVAYKETAPQGRRGPGEYDRPAGRQGQFAKVGWRSNR